MANRKAKLHEATIDYYEKHADEFVISTSSIDMGALYERFERYLSYGARILDLGCGSGRDSLYFHRRGYDVVAVDPSNAMCKKTRTIVDIPVITLGAEDLAFNEEFDGVWACASLLHIPLERIEFALKAIFSSLKDKGILYCSWKYGGGERIENGRFYSYYNELTLNTIIQQLREAKLIDVWISCDLRPDRSSEKWLNALIRKEKSEGRQIDNSL